jgi:hypothetical protein
MVQEVPAAKHVVVENTPAEESCLLVQVVNTPQLALPNGEAGDIAYPSPRTWLPDKFLPPEQRVPRESDPQLLNSKGAADAYHCCQITGPSPHAPVQDREATHCAMHRLSSPRDRPPVLHPIQTAQHIR